MQANRQIKQVVGSNIETARNAKGLTRRALAEKIGVDQGQVFKWERGLHRPVDASMTALSAALGRDVAWFYVDHAAVSA